jgi:hypothetical protein
MTQSLYMITNVVESFDSKSDGVQKSSRSPEFVLAHPRRSVDDFGIRS